MDDDGQGAGNRQTDRPPYRLHLFTLRIWPEVLDGEAWEWRGEVKNTSTGDIHYFRDWQVLATLLPTMLVGPVEYEVPDANEEIDIS